VQSGPKKSKSILPSFRPSKCTNALYHCFSLSLRDVELILAARGVVVSYESIREWGLRFGRLFANALKRCRPKPGDKWHLDGVSRTQFLSWNCGAV